MINQLWEEFKQEVEVDINALIPKTKLQPSFWNHKMILKESVRKKLNLIAKDFFESLKLPRSVKLKDVTITGSIAGYNWSKYSDLDLHLILDFSDVDENEELVKEYFGGKIFVWNTKHNIRLNDHEVEIYVQNEKEPHISGGIYSILKNKWLQKPILSEYEIDLETTKKKADQLMDQIERVYDLFELKKYPQTLEASKSLKEKIKEMRSSGLESEGIYAPENMAFKMLRRTGHLELLYKLTDKSYDRIMSLHKDIRGSLKIMIGNIEEEIEEAYDSLVEESNFQRRMKQKHQLRKKMLIGIGGQKNVPPYKIKPSYKRSKSAPAGFGGSE